MTAVCHSKEVMEALTNRSHIPARRVRRFPLGIDTEAFKPIDDATRAVTRRSLGIEESEVVVVAVGRPARSKRFDLAISALAESRRRQAPLLLLLIGVGQEPSLVSQREELGLGGVVHLLDGGLPATDLSRMIAASDILLSTSDYEGFGLTLIEGMSCGLPIVATAVGGVTDIVLPGKTGYLVEPGSKDAVTDRLVELAADGRLRKQLGAAGRSRAVEVFDVRTTADAFVSEYRRLALRRRHRAR